jgi:hypothetical protein
MLSYEGISDDLPSRIRAKTDRHQRLISGQNRVKFLRSKKHGPRVRSADPGKNSAQFLTTGDRSIESHPPPTLCCRGENPPQNFVTSVKLNSWTFMAGTTMSNDSSPQERTGALMASTFDNI